MRGKPVRVDENGCIACRTCGTIAPLDTFPKDNSKRLGYRTQCVSCKSVEVQRSNWYLNEREEARVRMDERAARKAAAAAARAHGPRWMQHSIILGKHQCCHCGEWKNVYEFHRDSTTATGLAYGCDTCKADKLARERSYNSVYKATNIERIRQRDRERNARMAPDKLDYKRQLTRDWFERHRGTETFRTKMREYRRRYRARGRAELDERYVRQQLRKQGFVNTDITTEIIELKRQQLEARRLARELRKAIANEGIRRDS